VIPPIFEEERFVGRSRLFLLVPLALCTVMLSGSGSAATGPLSGTVGPGFTITLKNAAGALVTRLDPGSYTINVRDLSAEHSFHLTGPGGVDQATDIAGTGSFTWHVTLVNGTYDYLCDAHPTLIHRSFRVGAAAAPLPKLSGRVGPGKAISLRRSGALVKQLPAGTYKLTVKDATKADNFHLFGSAVNKRTGVAFRGSRTWTVSFKVATTYTYRSDAHPKLRRTFKVVGKFSPPPPIVSGRGGQA
jgi:plastocyanin